MKLRLKRQDYSDARTIGRLSIDGVDFCFTLEDTVRTGPKVPGKTAIPSGTYAVKLTMSPRFGRILPLLVDVPGFDGVRIHPGNTAADTDGCILVGYTEAPGFVGRSRDAFARVFALISAARSAGETVTITIE